jgi:PAS domain S-box-containing protein
MKEPRTLRLTLVAAVAAALAGVCSAAGAPRGVTVIAAALGAVVTALVLALHRLHAASRKLAVQRDVATAAVEQVRWLSALVRAFSAATRPEEVAEVAFDGCRALGATHANIGWLAPNGREIETLFSYGHPEMEGRWQRYPLDAPMPNAAAVSTGAPQFLPDAASYDAAWPETAAERAKVGVGAWVSWPLSLASAPRGVLGIGFDGPRALSSAERDAAATIAEHAAQALERARLLARAEESERRFRLLAENAPDIVYRYRLGADAGFDYVSPSATEILGYTPEEHYADPLLARKLVLPEDLPLLDAAVTAPAGTPVVLRWRTRDGRVIWAEQRNVLLRDEAGAPVALEGIARDVTTRVELQAERERLLAEREDLLRAVSHDFRTPLQAVLLRAESLARDGSDPARVARLSRAIAESARRMGAAVQDVVHVARLADREVRPRQEVVPLAPFVSELTRRLFADAELARLDVALPDDAAVRADPAHLERIVVNLVDNALKYSDAPAPVRIRSERDGEHRVVTVSDDGPGIAPEDVPHLFRRYYRGTRQSSHQGTGLGLYVTRKLTEAQGGVVSVDSPPGRGATFRVRLPAA